MGSRYVGYLLSPFGVYYLLTGKKIDDLDIAMEYLYDIRNKQVSGITNASETSKATTNVSEQKNEPQIRIYLGSDERIPHSFKSQDIVVFFGFISETEYIKDILKEIYKLKKLGIMDDAQIYNL